MPRKDNTNGEKSINDIKRQVNRLSKYKNFTPRRAAKAARAYVKYTSNIEASNGYKNAMLQGMLDDNGYGGKATADAEKFGRSTRMKRVDDMTRKVASVVGKTVYNQRRKELGLSNG